MNTHNVAANCRRRLSKARWSPGPKTKWMTITLISSGYIGGNTQYLDSRICFYTIFCFWKTNMFRTVASIFVTSWSYDWAAHPIGGERGCPKGQPKPWMAFVIYCEKNKNIERWPLRSAPPGGGGVWCNVHQLYLSQPDGILCINK